MPQTVESGTSKSTLGPRAPQYPKVPVMISLTFIEQTPFPFCYVSFATSGADSRTTQMFINFSDNSNLDGMGFTPFARVIEGMDSCVDKLYSGYGEGGAGDGKDGRGPSQGRLQSEGNKYLKRTFPKMSYITSVRVVSDDAEL